MTVPNAIYIELIEGATVADAQRVRIDAGGAVRGPQGFGQVGGHAWIGMNSASIIP